MAPVFILSSVFSLQLPLNPTPNNTDTKRFYVIWELSLVCFFFQIFQAQNKCYIFLTSYVMNFKLFYKFINIFHKNIFTTYINYLP